MCTSPLVVAPPLASTGAAEPLEIKAKPRRRQRKTVWQRLQQRRRREVPIGYSVVNFAHYDDFPLPGREEAGQGEERGGVLRMLRAYYGEQQRLSFARVVSPCPASNDIRSDQELLIRNGGGPLRRGS